MDDSTAYRILKIREGTSIEDISKKHNHFVKLYKQHLMGIKTNISPEEIESMKKAYEHLLYKRLSDTELKNLYPAETYLSKIWDNVCKVFRPIVYRHKTKIIYTLVMFMLTNLIIFIINYKPVDLKVVVFSKSSGTLMETGIRNHILKSFENHTAETVPYIKRPIMEYGFYNENDEMIANRLLYIWGDSDVYIMEEQLLRQFQEAGTEFSQIARVDLDEYQQTSGMIQDGTLYVSEFYIDEDSYIYKNICNWENTNNNWVAVVDAHAPHKAQAVEFLKFILGD